MQLISARKGFWSNNELALSDEIRSVDLVGELPSQPVSEANFLAGTAGKNILLLVHGYNNEPEDVHNAYAILEDRMSATITGAHAYDEVVGYIWPGGDDIFDYPAAKTRANALARRFGLWLQKLSDNGTTVDLMGHSMGARVIFKGLKTRNNSVARNVFTMAAAVDNESIEIDEEFFTSTRRTENTFVFHSKHDPVLRTGYRIAEFDNALGLRGPEDPQDIIDHSSPDHSGSPNVFVVNCKNQIRKHGAYKRTDDVYDYIDSFLGGTVPNQYVTLPK